MNPPYPHNITKLVIIVVSGLIMINCVNFSVAQNYNYRSLPELDSLVKALELADSLNLDAELVEYKKTYKFNALYLIPSVGYDMINQRPLVMFSASGIITHLKNKRVVKRKQISMEAKAELKHQNNRIKLTNYYNDLEFLIVQLDMTYETYTLYQKLYDLKVKQYAANEINTETFLKEEIAFSTKKKVILSLIERINEKFSLIELLINELLFKYLTYDIYVNENG